jgi:hypothetical protein
MTDTDRTIPATALLVASILLALVAGGLADPGAALAQNGPPPPQTVPSIGLNTPPALLPATVPSIGLRTPPAQLPATVPSIGLSSPGYAPITAPSIGLTTPRPYEVPSIGLRTPPAFPAPTVPSIGLTAPQLYAPATVPSTGTAQ